MVTAQIAGRKEVFLLDRAEADALQKSLLYFQYKHLLQFEIDHIKKIELYFRERQVQLERGRNRVWKVSLPRKRKMSNNLTPYLLLRDLWRLEFTRILNPDEAEKSAEGSSPIVVDVWMDGGEHLAKYAIWYARGMEDAAIVELFNRHYLVEGKFIGLLKKHLQEIYGQLRGI